MQINVRPCVLKVVGWAGLLAALNLCGQVEVPRNFTVISNNAVAGPGTLTKTGAGILSLVSSSGNTFNNDIAVGVDGGTLRIGGNTFIASGTSRTGTTLPNLTTNNTITVGRGGIFEIKDNAVTTFGYVANRLGSAGNRPKVSLEGGTLLYNGAAIASTLMTQSVGQVTLASGASTITINRNTSGTPNLIARSLILNPGAYVQFVGNTLGTGAADVSRVLFETAPASVGGGGAAGSKTMSIVPGMRYGSDLLYYGANGLRALVAATEYDDVDLNDINKAASALSNVRINNASPAAFPALSADMTVNSLVLTAAATATWAMGNKLTITSGQLLSTPSNTRNISSGSLTAGAGGDTDLDISVLASTTTLGANVVDNGSGKITLVKNGAGGLVLANNEDSTYSGGTIINEGPLTTGATVNRRYFGTGPVRVYNALLTLGAIGSTANNTGDDFTAFHAGQIALSAASYSDHTFNIGAGSVIAGVAATLNSLDRGLNDSATTNITLAADAVIAHPALTTALNLGTGTIKNLGTAADLYYGLNANQASAAGSIAIGNGTAFKGISATRSAMIWQLGTINVAAGTDNIYLQGLAMAGIPPSLLTLGNNALLAGGPVINLADSGSVDAQVLNYVTLDDNAAVYGDAVNKLNFVVNSGALLTLNQSDSMGSGAGIATAQVKDGGTLALANPAAINGDVTFEAGSRITANNAGGLAGTGALAFDAGSLIEVGHAVGFSGPQAAAATVEPGTIVRLNIASFGSATDPLNNYFIGKSPVFELYSANATTHYWHINPVSANTTILTLNRDETGKGGMLVNRDIVWAAPAVPNGVVAIGPNGGVIASSPNMLLTLAQPIALSSNELVIGSMDMIDRIMLPKLGQVTLSALPGYSTAAIGSKISIIPGAQLNNAANSLPDAAEVAVAGIFNVAGADTIGSLSGTGLVTLAANALTIGRNNGDATFSGKFDGTSGGLVKTGTGRLDLTGGNSTWTLTTPVVTVNGGTLALSGEGKLPHTGTAAFTVIGDGTLHLDNSVTDNNNRLTGTAPGVTFQGGTFRFTGKDNTASSESLGAAAFASGISTIDIVNGTNASSEVTFTTATPGAGTVKFTASNGTLGSSGNNPRVKFTGLAAGLVGYGTVGSAPAYHDATYGIRAFSLGEGTEFNGTAVQTALNTVFTTNNVYPTLSAARIVNSLWIDNPGTGKFVDMATYNLSLASGRISLTGTNNFEIKRTSTGLIANSVVNGKLFLGVADAGTTLTVSSPIANGTGTVDKDGAGTLVLNAANTFTTGGLVVNDGTVKYGASGDLAATAALTTQNDGLFDVAGKTDTIGAVILYAGGITNSVAGGTLTIGALTMGSGPAGSSAYVNTGTGALTLGGTVTYNVVNDPNTATIAGKINLNTAARSIVVNDSVAAGAAIDLDVPAIVQGTLAQGFTKTGTGTMRLGGNNTFDGPVIATGTLRLSHPKALGIPSADRVLTLNALTTLVLDGSNGAIALPARHTPVSLNTANTLFGPVSGSLVNWSGNNSVSGAVTIAASTQLASLKAGDKLTLSGAMTGGNYSLTVDGAGDTELSGARSTSGTSGSTLVKNGSGTLTLSGAGANTYAGATTVNGGKLVLAKSGGVAAMGSTAVTVNNGAKLQYAAGTVDQMGAPAVTINGSGCLDINGATDTIGALAIVANAALSPATSDTTAITNTTGGGNLTITTLTVTPTPGYLTRIDSGSGTLTLGGNVATVLAATGRTQISGKLDLGAATRTFTPVVSTYSLYDLDIDAVISGGAGAGLTTATGRLRLSGANTYPGDTTISSGTLKMGASNVIPNGSGKGNVILSATSSILDMNGCSDTINGLSSAVASFVDNTAASSACTLAVGDNDQTSTFAGTIQNTAGTLALTKVGGGVLTLSKASTYAGDTTVTDGTLKYGIANAIPSGAGKGNVIVNAKLDLAALSSTINGLSGSGTVDNSTGAATYTLTVGGNNQTSAFGGVITNASGTLALTKTGTGTLTLTGGNGYAGLTTVSAGGALNVQNTTGLGTTAAGTTVASGGALQIQGGTAVGAEALTLSGTGVALDGALRNISGTNSYAGLITLALAGTRINADADLLTLDVPSGNAIAGAFNVVFGGAGDVTVSDPIATGAGTLTKDGAGTLTLAGVNTFSGVTTVNGGTLRVAATNALLASAGVTVNNGGWLDPGVFGLAGSTTVVSKLTLASGSAINIECAAGVNDRIFVNSAAAGSLTLNGGGIYLYAQGTTAPWTTCGRYDLIRFNGTLGGSSANLSVLNPQPNLAYTFVTSGNWISLLIVDTTLAQSWDGGSSENSFWTTADNWSLDNTPDVAALLTFAGSTRLAATNDFAPNTSFSGLIFDSTAGAFALTGNAFNLLGNVTNRSTSSQTINLPLVLDGASRTISADAGDIVIGGTIGEISGGLGLVKIGTNTLVLAGANTFSGAAAIQSGVLNVRNSTGLGTAAGGVTVADGAALQVQDGIAIGAEALSLNGMGVSSNGALRSVSGVNSYAGLITLASDARIHSDGGTFRLDPAAGSAIAGATRSVTLGGAGDIVVADPIATTTGSLTKDGLGTLTLSAANTFTGPTRLEAGKLRATSVVGALGGAGQLQLAGGVLEFANDAALSITKNAVSVLAPIAIVSDRLNSAGAGATFTLGTLAIGSQVMSVSGGNLVTSGTAGITLGTTTLSGSPTFVVTDPVNGGGTKLTLGAVSGSGDLNFKNNGATANGITVGAPNHTGRIFNTGTGSGSTLISGIIGLNVMGVVQDSPSSMLTLSGISTFTGGSLIKQGILRGTVAAAFGASSSPITIGDATGNADTVLLGGGAVTFAQPITVAAGNTGTASITNSAACFFSGLVTLDNHDLTLASAASLLSLSGGMAGTGDLVLLAKGAGGITVYNKIVNHSGSIVNAGTGSGLATVSGGVGSNVTAIVQNATNSAFTVGTGALTVNADGTTLVNNNISGAKQLTLSAAVNGIGDLILENNSAITNGVYVTGAPNHSGRIINAGAGPGNTWISGIIGPNVTRVVQASTNSVLTLTGVNTYAGGTTVNTGATLRVNLTATAGSVTGTGDIDVSGTLDGNVTARGYISGTVILNDGGTVSPSLNARTAGGKLTIGNLTWHGGGVLDCVVTKVAGAVGGVDYGQVVVGGGISCLPGDTNLVIRLDTLGQTFAYDPGINYSFRVLDFVTAGMSTNVDLSTVRIDTNAFLVAGGTWSLTNMYNGIYVVSLGTTAEPDVNVWICQSPGYAYGYWSDEDNWSLGHSPWPGEDVLFDFYSYEDCYIDVVTNSVGSITMAGGYPGSLVFWTSYAGTDGYGFDSLGVLTNLVVTGNFAAHNGILSHKLNAYGATAGNRLSLSVGGDFMLGPSASVRLDGLGYPANQGPGAGFNGASALGRSASHGGAGANNPITSSTYGSITKPETLGSSAAGIGGGALFLRVGGAATLDGLVSAQGTSVSATTCPGAGGSLFIQAATISGSGTLQAGVSTALPAYYGSGGGRIAVIATSGASLGALTFRANPHTQALNGGGRAGTIYLETTAFKRLIIDQEDIGTASANQTDLPAVAETFATHPAFGGDLEDVTLILTNGAFVALNRDLRMGTVDWLDGTLALQSYTLYLKSAEPAGSFPADYGAGITNLSGVFHTFENGDTLVRDGRILWGDPSVTWRVATMVYQDAGGTATNKEEVNEGYFADGSSLEFEATPDLDMTFRFWDGTIPDGATRYDNPLFVTSLDGNSAFRAWFTTNIVDVSNNRWVPSSVSDDWSVPYNWSLLMVPVAGQTVTIPAGSTVRLNGATAALAGFTIETNAVLTFEGWNSTLEATNLTIRGRLTHLAQTVTETNALGLWVPQHRIWVKGQNLTITSTGLLDGDYRGYLPGAGPGRAINSLGYGSGGGGGYGGRGASGFDREMYGIPYCEPDDPWQPGSGGGYRLDMYGVSSRPAGGAIRIEMTGQVTIDGTVTARGENPAGTHGTAGSGGGIAIYCSTLQGAASGLVRADGGRGNYYGGSGAGGRIAVHFDPVAQAALPIPQPPVRFSTQAWLTSSRGDSATMKAEIGTLYLTDIVLVTANPTGNVVLEGQRFWHNRLYIGNGFTSWSPASLVISNCVIGFPAGFELDVGGDLVIGGGVGIAAPLTGTLQGGLHLHAAATNAMYGARLAVGRDLLIGSAAWLYPHTEGTSAAFVGVRVGRHVTIATGGGIDADNKGYLPMPDNDNGPGAGQNLDRGGAYGGRGGGSNLVEYASGIYGLAPLPLEPGSPGGWRPGGTYTSSGKGGGVIHVLAGGNLTINGLLTANGDFGTYLYGAGGSGGAILISGMQVGGSGVLSANGGYSPYDRSPGGGGRIAVWHHMPLTESVRRMTTGTVNDLMRRDGIAAFDGQVTVTVSPMTMVGENYIPAEAGTWGFYTGRGTLFLVR